MSELSARAVERSLADQRNRSLSKVLEIVDAARSLAEQTGNAGFTMQQVAEHAGVSLKTIYRYFPGKDDLLLALLEQDSQRGATLLRLMAERKRSPLTRLEASVTGLFELMAAGDTAYVTVLVREYLRLSDTRNPELRRALAPLVDVVRDEITAAAHSGAVRRGDAERDARTVFDLAVLQIADLVLGPAPASAEIIDDTATYLWNFVSRGLALAQPGDRQ